MCTFGFTPCGRRKWGRNSKNTRCFRRSSGCFAGETRIDFFWCGSGRATSALDVQAIVGETHALGELAVGLALAAGLVTHVDEIGVLGVHPARHLHRLFDGLVRVVRFVAQGTHHQRAHAAQFRPFAVGQGGEIGHVG